MLTLAASWCCVLRQDGVTAQVAEVAGGVVVVAVVVVVVLVAVGLRDGYPDDRAWRQRLHGGSRCGAGRVPLGAGMGTIVPGYVDARVIDRLWTRLKEKGLDDDVRRKLLEIHRLR